MSIRSPWRVDSHVSMSSASSCHPDAARAVRDLARELGDDAQLYSVFVSPGYDLDAVARSVHEWCGDRVLGCASSGNIGDGGYERRGITAIALRGGGLRVQTIQIGPLSDLPQAMLRAGGELSELRAAREGTDGFAVLLVDGLSRREDQLAATLAATLSDVPIIGGSAGDGLAFTSCPVLSGGRFVEDVATLTMVTLNAPFRLFRLQHHEPTDVVLVASDASADRRLIRELNGQPAAQAYAEAVGLEVDALDSVVFSTHPLMLRAAGTSWVRSISTVNPDGTLGTFAAVDTGDVLRVGRPVDMVQALESSLASVTAELGQVAGVIAFDCILRRTEFEACGLDSEVGRVLAGHRVAGFSTYGEQFNGMHMNQTMVAVAFGAAADQAD